MIVSQLPNKKIKDRREKLTENVKLYQAAASDIEEITGLYEQAKGSKFCTWDEHYPNTEITWGDLERDALFCMKTETGEIVGAISIDDDKEVENLKCWSKTLKPSVEIARLVVKTEWQNKKKETLTHPYLKEKVEWGMVPYVQAMLLARYLRGDLDGYPVFLWK